MSGSKLQAVRGMNDILPSHTPYWQLLENACCEIAQRYAYREIRFPIVEPTMLFQRTLGVATDIVEKEMYTFADRNGDSLTLRPEGTAGCARAVIEQSLLQQQPLQRLWYRGPMFRHERPQKGRYRQFHQFGVEALGMTGPDIDAEQICMMHRLWQQLGLGDQVQLQINSLGTAESRAAYRETLVAYLQAHHTQLDEDSQRRLTTNPLRILDSKNPAMQELIRNAPKLMDHLDGESRAHFEGLQRLLQAANIPYEINPTLVRGLDYYGFTVYEWVTTALGAQGTVCAGGRYNGLIEHLGGQPTPAVGFAMGLERVVLLLEQLQPQRYTADVYMVLAGDAATVEGFKLAEQLRQACPALRVETNCAGGNFKTQFKRADKSGAQWAVILGENEVTERQVALKNLREEQPQQMLSYDKLIEFFMQ